MTSSVSELSTEVDGNDTLPEDFNENKHWVEDLFQPAFGFTLDEIFAPKPEKPKTCNVFEQYAQKIRPVNTEAIKNVYERVWLISAIEQEELDKRTTDLSELHRNQSQQTQTSVADLGPEERTCIWTASEINVLREIFHAAQDENRKLKAALQESDRRCAIYQRKYKELCETSEPKLQTAEKAFAANQRLQILLKNLQTQVKTANNSVKELQQERLDHIQERHTLEEQVAELKKQLLAEKMNKRHFQREVEKQSADQLRREQLMEDKMQQKYVKELKRLSIKVDELEEELFTESKQHIRTKLGLDQLRKHFSSLPYMEDLAGTVICENELTKLSY